MNYTTYAPNEELSAFIKCYWTLEFPKENRPEKQRIVPDGCMEMIFHYGDPYIQFIEGEKYIVQPRCFVFGQISNTLEIKPKGKTGIFAVRFHPEGFSPFATIPVSSMENRAVPLQELFGDEGIQIEKAVLNASTTEERIAIVEKFLLNKLSTKEAVDRVVKSCVGIIMHLNGQVPIVELSEQLKINRRQLERKFTSVIGLSPKQLSKIIKLHATLKMLASKQFTSLTSLAYEGGYYDQTHFIKDFKEFTGMTPKQFYQDNFKMSSLFLSTD